MSRIHIFILFLLGILAESAVLLFGSWKKFNIAILLHVLAVIFCWLSLYFYQKLNLRKNKWHSINLFSFSIITFFPGIGLIGVILLYGVIGGLGKRLQRHIFEDYEAYILEKSKVDFKDQALYSLQESRQEVDFEPFIDVLQGTDIRAKSRVIKKLSKTISQENVKLLKAALKDISAEVRLYAAGALVQMEAELNESIQKALETVKRTGTFKSYVDLGDLYRSFVEMGLMERTLAKYYWQLAADAYRNSLDINTNQPEVVIHYSRCLMALGEHGQAKDFVDRALHVWPQQNDLLFLNTSIQFQLGTFDKIHEGLKTINLDELDESQKEVVHFWVSDRN